MLLTRVDLATDTMGADPKQIQNRFPPENKNAGGNIYLARKCCKVDTLPQTFGDVDRIENISALMISTTSNVQSPGYQELGRDSSRNTKLTTSPRQLRMHLLIGFIVFSIVILIIPQLVMSFRYLMEVHPSPNNSSLIYQSITIIWYVVHSLATLFMWFIVLCKIIISTNICTII